MQPPRERKSEGGPALPCGGNTLADESTGHVLVSPGSGGAAPRAQGQAGRCPSGGGFLRKRFPFLLKRKEPLQGQAVPRSRLCVEDAHESPIQAFRKAAPRGQPRAPDSDDDSTAGKGGPSLLRRLLCLKARPSKLQQPHWGVEAAPLRQAGGGCGPVAALSRTADPHGESPLRWKPRTEDQHAPEVAAAPEPEQTGPAGSPPAPCAPRPWRTFRALLSSRAKKGSVLPGRERSCRTAGEGNPGPSPGPDASPAPQRGPSSREQQSNQGAAEDQHPPPGLPPDAGGPCRVRKEKEGPRTPWHGQRGDPSDPAPRELNGFSPRGEEKPGPQPALEPDLLHRRVSDWSGEGGAREDGSPEEQGGDGGWAEGLAGGNQDLADLAENPGGQGMVMGTRDLGWLTSELLGGPTSRPGGWRVDAPVKREPGEENAGSRGTAREPGHAEEERVGAGDCPGPGAAAQPSRHLPSPPCGISGGHTLEVAGSPLLGSPQEPDPAASLRPRGSSGHAAPAGLASQLQGSPRRAQPAPEESCRVAAPPASAAPEDAQSKRQLYRAAAEIVGAAINAAAGQLAQKEGRAMARSRGLEDEAAEAPIPGPATEGGEEGL